MIWERCARICFGVTFVVAIGSLGWQFVQDMQGVWDGPGVVGPPQGVRAWRFFSYFTTQANLLVAVTSFTLARRVDTDGPVWRVARLDALGGISITGLVHGFLLHPLDHFQGAMWVTDNLVHIVVPTLAVVCWLAFGPRRRTTFRVVLAALIWPLAWLLYTLVMGALTGWYPYFFLDVGESGAGAVAVYCVAILVLLFAVSCLFWLGDRFLRLRPDSSSSTRPSAGRRATGR